MPEQNEATRIFLEKKKEKEWRNTISGKIYSKLEQMASEHNTHLHVKNRGGMVEMFTFGDETAVVVKHLGGATVAEETGTVTSYAESWEYRNLPWWREVHDRENLPMEFLDTPVARAAQDAAIENSESIFHPSVVVETYKLADPNDGQAVKRMQDWVKQELVSQLSEALQPDFTATFYDQLVRITPVSEEAKKSLLAENNVYRTMLDRLKYRVSKLQETYRAKRDSEV